MLAGWKAKVDALKRDVTAVALAARDPRTPWVARLLVLAIVAYAVSPIDLIPDFIPVLGLLDELLLLPLALLAAVRMIPVDVMRDAREQANDQRLAPSWAAALLIVLIWLVVVAWLAHLALPLLVG